MEFSNVLLTPFKNQSLEKIPLCTKEANYRGGKERLETEGNKFGFSAKEHSRRLQHTRFLLARL